MRHPLNIQNWLSPRQAANLCGEELYGNRWKESYLDESPQHPKVTAVRNDLYAALCSGEVSAFINEGEEPKKLGPAELVHPAFAFRFKQDCVQVGQTLTDWRCEIHAAQLDQFLRKQRRRRQGTSAAELAEKRFTSLLTEKMRGAKSGVKEDWLTTARDEFGMSIRAFNRCWKEAIERSGSKDWSQSGRPKKSKRKS